MKKPVTHCKHGHEFTEENTRPRADGGRECITCRRERDRARRAKRRKEFDENPMCEDCGERPRQPTAPVCAQCKMHRYGAGESPPTLDPKGWRRSSVNKHVMIYIDPLEEVS